MVAPFQLDSLEVRATSCGPRARLLRPHRATRVRERQVGAAAATLTPHVGRGSASCSSSLLVAVLAAAGARCTARLRAPAAAATVTLTLVRTVTSPPPRSPCLGRHGAVGHLRAVLGVAESSGNEVPVPVASLTK